MSLMAMLRARTRTKEETEDRKEQPDPRPIEATPLFIRPISSLDDLRRMMKQLSEEAEAQGLESFEEFYDFGEDSAFEDIPAPAQMKHDAIMLARDRDFEAEIIDAKAKYKERLNEDAKASLLAELRKKQEAEAAAEDE